VTLHPAEKAVGPVPTEKQIRMPGSERGQFIGEQGLRASQRILEMPNQRRHEGWNLLGIQHDLVVFGPVAFRCCSRPD
jgi:hypothetical protein